MTNHFEIVDIRCEENTTIFTETTETTALAHPTMKIKVVAPKERKYEVFG
jgi:hypothetical protein